MNLFPNAYLDVIGRLLLKRKETIAVAESVTSGLMQAAFSSIGGAIWFFQGGITAYNVAQKYKHLNVEPVHALSCNGVSEKVATEMALQVCRIFNSNWGIGITGYATPVPESRNELFSYYTISYNGEIKKATRLASGEDELLNVQLFYCNTVLKVLSDVIALKI